MIDYKELEHRVTKRLLTPNNPNHKTTNSDVIYKSLVPLIAHAVIISLQEYDHMQQQKQPHP